MGPKQTRQTDNMEHPNWKIPGTVPDCAICVADTGCCNKSFRGGRAAEAIAVGPQQTCIVEWSSEVVDGGYGPVRRHVPAAAEGDMQPEFIQASDIAADVPCRWQ
eukprot:1063326-Amphidinium_carterae.1